MDEIEGLAQPAKDRGEAESGQPPKRFQVSRIPKLPTTARDILNQPSRRPIVERLVFEGSSTMVFSPEKIGKSFVLLRVALNVASGTPFLGHWRVEPGRVLLIDPENGTETAERLRRLAPLYDGREDMLDRIFIHRDPVKLNDRKQLRELIADYEPYAPFNLTGVDTIRSTLDGEANSTQDASRWADGLDEVRMALGGGQLVCHHTPRNNSERYSNSGVFGARIDHHYRFSAGPKAGEFAFFRTASRSAGSTTWGGRFRVDLATEAANFIEEFTGKPRSPTERFVLDFAADHPQGFTVNNAFAAGPNIFKDRTHAWTACKALYDSGELVRGAYRQRAGSPYYLPEHAIAAGIIAAE